MSWEDAQRNGYQVLSIYDPGESFEPPQATIRPERVGKKGKASSASTVMSGPRARTGEQRTATIASVPREAKTEPPKEIMKGGIGLHYLKGWKRHTATIHFVYDPKGNLRTSLIERNYDEKTRIVDPDETVEMLSESLNSGRFDPDTDKNWRHAKDFSLY